MRFSSFATVIAASASMASAQDYAPPAGEVDTTTTITSTTTQQVTVTSCHPDYTDCPLLHTTTSTEVVITTTSEEPTTTEEPSTTWVPTTQYNTTTPVSSTSKTKTKTKTKPTAYHHNTTATTPTGHGYDTTGVTVPTGNTPPAGNPSSPPVEPSGNAANNLLAQSGVVGFAVLAAAAALL